MDVLVRMREKNLIAGEEAMAGLAELEKHGRYGAGIVQDARRKIEGE